MIATDRNTDTPQIEECLTMTASLRHGPVPVSDMVQRYICWKQQGSLSFMPFIMYLNIA